MNLRDFEYLIALAETNHFGRAADRCGVTQPTLSTQIGKLENEIGVRIFERGAKTITPTTVGWEVIDQAKRILGEVHNLRKIATRSDNPLAGPFHLGAIPTAGPYVLPHILPAIRDLHPDTTLYVREQTTAELLDQLAAGKLEAAILSPPVEDPSVEWHSLLTEDFVVALPTDHALAKKKKISGADLEKENILFLEEGNCMRDQTVSFCQKQRALPQDAYRASTVETLRQMVQAGVGCTLLPELATEGPFAECARIAYRRFTEPVPHRDLVLAWRKTYPLANTLRKLAAELEDAITKSRKAVRKVK